MHFEEIIAFREGLKDRVRNPANPAWVVSLALDAPFYIAKAVLYCRSMIRGSAESGTSRHCALSSASKCQMLPLSDISSIWPCSSRHCVGANAVTAGSHFGFRKTWKLS